MEILLVPNPVLRQKAYDKREIHLLSDQNPNKIKSNDYRKLFPQNLNFFQ